MRAVRFLSVVSVLALAFFVVGSASAADGNAAAAKACQKDGYLRLVGADGTTFTTVGACVSFAARGGTFATGMVIPAGHTANLSDVEFGDFTTNCPTDPLAYGYELNLGAAIQLATGGGGCSHAPDVVIGPFATATLLRLWLTDSYGPVYTFYSDGSHALVSGTSPWRVSIADSYMGLKGPDVSVPIPGPGLGNFNVTVTIS